MLDQNIRLIGGYRWNMKQSGDKNNAFAGIGLSTPTVLGFNAYASYVAGKDFNEAQVGLNKSLIANLDLNVNYHNFKPDHGSRENGVGVGVNGSDNFICRSRYRYAVVSFRSDRGAAFSHLWRQMEEIITLSPVFSCG